MTTPAPDLAVELAISRLQGSMDKNFAEVQGKLDLLTRDGIQNSSDITSLESRVTDLERRVYVFSGAAALLGMSVPFIFQAVTQ